MIKIVIDGFGGDNAPVEIVKGVVSAINKNNDIHIVITGKEVVLQEEFAKYTYDKERVTVVNADSVITNDDVPTTAIRSKRDSSLVVAFDYARENEDCVGLISAGSTGAVLTGAFMKCGRLKGIHRPALCPVLPTKKGGVVCICDSGANMDCKPEYLQQFALMGSAYLKTIGVENPRVAQLNVGTEDHKGDTRAKESFELIKNLGDKVKFVGNMEARDLLSGDYDLIVTDGFAGNVLLKSTEGAVKNLLSMLKAEIKSSFVSKIGALFMKKSFGSLKKKMDYNRYGGAVLLGCKKLIVKCHGSSNDTSILAAIEQVYKMSKGNLIENIANELGSMGLEENE